MRAIEKNILVVSTREPGPITRRGETGDGMVNGSVEEDAASVTQQQQPPPSSQPSSPQPSSQPSSQSSQTTQSPAQPAQPTSQDVDMDWEKDCSSTVTISVHTVESEPPLLHSGVIPAADSALTKNLFADEIVREKLEQAASRTDIAASNYITAVSDFSTISNLNLQPHGPETIATAVPVVQSLPTVETVSDNSIVPGGDITVAIMNEDTSSQPNLENMENEEIEATATASTTTSTTTTTTTASTVTATTTTATSTTSTSAAATTTVTVVATVIPLTTDTTRKLQAAFQAKRFESGDNKCMDKSNEKTTDPSTLGSAEEEIGHPMKNEDTTLTKSSPEHMDPNEISCDESRLTENLLQTDIEMRSNSLADNAESVIEERVPDKPKEEGTSILEDIDEENLRSTSDQNINITTFIESQSMEKDSIVASDECVSAVIVSNSEALYKTEKSEIHSEEATATISSTECFARDQPMSQKTESMEAEGKILEAIPTAASSNNNTNGQEVQEFNDDNLNIMEVSNDKITLVESMASDPISIVEKSKEATSVIEKLDPVSPIETTESSDNVSCRSPKNDKSTDVQDDSLANSQGNKATACITIKGNQSSVIESIVCRKESMELMEIGDEESLSTFQQDEPMEQETMEESKS